MQDHQEDVKDIVDLALYRMKSGEVVRETRRHKIRLLVVAMTIVLPTGYVIFQSQGQPQVTSDEPRSSVTADGLMQVEIPQDRYGHYVFRGEINGKPVNFLLDTGATYVAIPFEFAHYLGLTGGTPHYMETANGKSLGYATQIRNIKVGDIEMTNIEGSIATGMTGNQVLLGMSFLKNLSIEQSHGTIRLTSH